MCKRYNKFILFQNGVKELFHETDFYPEDIRDLTTEQVESIKNILESHLSPENLYEDGEASKETVEAKLDNYHMLCREINANTEHKFEIKDLQY